MEPMLGRLRVFSNYFKEFIPWLCSTQILSTHGGTTIRSGATSHQPFCRLFHGSYADFWRLFHAGPNDYATHWPPSTEKQIPSIKMGAPRHHEAGAFYQSGQVHPTQKQQTSHSWHLRHLGIGYWGAATENTPRSRPQKPFTYPLRLCSSSSRVLNRGTHSVRQSPLRAWLRSFCEGAIFALSWLVHVSTGGSQEGGQSPRHLPRPPRHWDTWTVSQKSCATLLATHSHVNTNSSSPRLTLHLSVWTVCGIFIRRVGVDLGRNQCEMCEVVSRGRRRVSPSMVSQNWSSHPRHHGGRSGCDCECERGLCFPQHFDTFCCNKQERRIYCVVKRRTRMVSRRCSGHLAPWCHDHGNCVAQKGRLFRNVVHSQDKSCSYSSPPNPLLPVSFLKLRCRHSTHLLSPDWATFSLIHSQNREDLWFNAAEDDAQDAHWVTLGFHRAMSSIGPSFVDWNRRCKVALVWFGIDWQQWFRQSPPNHEACECCSLPCLLPSDLSTLCKCWWWRVCSRFPLSGVCWVGERSTHCAVAYNSRELKCHCSFAISSYATVVVRMRRPRSALNVVLIKKEFRLILSHGKIHTILMHMIPSRDHQPLNTFTVNCIDMRVL